MGHLINEEDERRKQNPIMNEIMQKVEKAELQLELKHIVNKLDSIPAKLSNNYLKKTDINNFDNYKQIMTNLKN